MAGNKRSEYYLGVDKICLFPIQSLLL